MRMRERILIKITWHLPRDMILWAAMRLFAHAWGYKGDETPDEINIIEAARRWEGEG